MKKNELYRHIKTGGLYEIICHAKQEHNQLPVVVYASKKDGDIWVRSAAEFYDGRFEKAYDSSQS